MSTKVLIMGGTEFVSSAFSRYLIAKGYRVDIFTRGKREVDYEGVNRHLIGDRSNIDDLCQLKEEEYDYVYDINAYTEEDVKLTIECISRKKLKRYLFCSSGGVYLPSETVLDEKAPRGHNLNWGTYGLNKVKAENYLFKLHAESSFPITIFRPPYIYGPGNNLYRESYLFDRLTKGLALPIPHGNRTKAQFLYIDDLVKVVEAAALNEKANGEAYNIVYPEDISWKELVLLAAEAVGSEAKIKMINPSLLEKLGLKDRDFFPFRDTTALFSIDKLKIHSLPLPQIALKEGLKLSYAWYMEKGPAPIDKKMNKIETVLTQ